MQIQVKCGCADGNCPEWAIVELQGVVETQTSFQGQIQNLEIGRLCSPSQGTYAFTIGYHELLGTKTQLKKPLLVMKKHKRQAVVSPEELQKVGGNPNLALPGNELEVIGIIRHRILFKSRPKALISSKSQIK